MSAQKEQHKYNPLLTYVTGAYIVDSLFKKLGLGLGSYKKKYLIDGNFIFNLFILTIFLYLLVQLHRHLKASTLFHVFQAF